MQNEKLEGTFIDSYKTFSLSRPALSQILKIAIESSDSSNAGSHNVSFEMLREGTTLGTKFIDGMRNYARHTGLLDAKDYPTKFGQVVYSNDAEMSMANTQWIMHYNLASARKGSLTFWRSILPKVLKTGNTFTRANVADIISQSIQEHNHPYAERTLENASTAFIGTYFRKDALDALGLLQKQGDQYVVGEPEAPSVDVVAYIIAVHWEEVWNKHSTIDLREVTSMNGPSAMLFLNSSETDYYLAEMQEVGLLEVHRRVPPYQVVRLWDTSEKLLERLYE